MSLTATERSPIATIGYNDIGSPNSNTNTAENQLNNINTKEKFDNCLVQSIDEVIASLGAPVMHEFYDQLERNFKIQKIDIPERIEEFMELVHRIFGLGATRLELKFLQVLSKRMQARICCPECEYTVSKWIEMDVSFIDTLSRLRSQYLN